MIVTTLLLAQAAIASPASVTWDSITLGAPASSIRARFGDPLRVVVFDKPPQHVARYSFPGSDSTYVLVMEERGYVKVNAPMLHASVDEDGAPQLAGQVSATTRVRYGFKNGRVTAILWSTSVLHDGADGPPLADPAGDSISTAILNMQTNEIDGVAWEYRYLAFHPCGNDGRWRLKQQALMNKEGRATICFTSCVHRRRSNATSFSTSQTFSASSEQKFASALDGRASALDLRSR